jgi:hypothetical protein
VTNHDARRWAVLVLQDRQGVVGPEHYRVTAIKPEGNLSRSALAVAAHLDCAKSGVIDIDFEFLSWSD